MDAMRYMIATWNKLHNVGNSFLGGKQSETTKTTNDSPGGNLVRFPVTSRSWSGGARKYG